MTIYPEYFANNATTTLASNSASGDATISVASASGFPANPQFRILVDAEIMIVTNISGTTFTVTRGADGTTAASHTSGATVAQILTTGNLVRANEMVDAFGAKERGRSYISQGNYVSFTAGQTQTLLDTSIDNPNTPGYIDSIWLGNNATAGHSSLESATLSVYIDGSGAPSFSCACGSIFMSPWSGTLVYNGGSIGFQWQSSNTGSGFFRLKMPFTTSIKVTLTNGDGSNSCEFFWDISYKLTPNYTINWGRAKRLCNSENSGVSISAYTVQQLASVSGRGLFYGWTNVFKGGDSNLQFLEGTPELYIDGEGTASNMWSGTEDFFLNGAYFFGGTLCSADHGCVAVSASSGLAAAYRFLLNDPIPFDAGFVFKWPNGISSRATVTNNTLIYGNIYYYLDS